MEAVVYYAYSTITDEETKREFHKQCSINESNKICTDNQTLNREMLKGLFALFVSSGSKIKRVETRIFEFN